MEDIHHFIRACDVDCFVWFRARRRVPQVPMEKWFTYGGERSGRFEGMKNKDGSDKTECGIHSK